MVNNVRSHVHNFVLQTVLAECSNSILRYRYILRYTYKGSSSSALPATSVGFCIFVEVFVCVTFFKNWTLVKIVFSCVDAFLNLSSFFFFFHS